MARDRPGDARAAVSVGRGVSAIQATPRRSRAYSRGLAQTQMSRSAPRCPGAVPGPGPGSPDRPTENGLEEHAHAHEDEEDLEDEVDSARLEKFMRDRRRARSLPACTAALLDPESGRKRVKFADSMGLTLARVRHFSIQEDPQVPVQVLSRHGSLPVPVPLPRPRPGSGSGLVACFPELRDVDRRVRQLRVCLETLVITQFDVRGHIRVLLGGGRADVGVRYSFNDWRSYVDAQAAPVVSDGLVGERFSFTVYTPPATDTRASVHLAVYLRTEDGDFWDNNDTHNYTLQCRRAHEHAPLHSALHYT